MKILLLIGICILILGCTPNNLETCHMTLMNPYPEYNIVISGYSLSIIHDGITEQMCCSKVDEIQMTCMTQTNLKE